MVKFKSRHQAALVLAALSASLLLLLLLLLAGCAATGGRQPSEVASWYSPPAEYPGICMRLMADGKLRFDGGFDFFNPGHWSQDSGAAELRLRLGGTAPFPAQLVSEQLKQHEGGLLRADAAQRTLVYRVGPATQTLALGGFVFYRQPACGK